MNPYQLLLIFASQLLLSSCAQIEPDKSKKIEPKQRVVIDPYKKMQPKQIEMSDSEREAYRAALIQKFLIAPMAQNNQLDASKRSAWTARAYGINNCEVTKITQMESTPKYVRFAINFSCKSKSGYAGSSSVGDLVCGENQSNQTQNNNFIARCE